MARLPAALGLAVLFAGAASASSSSTPFDDAHWIAPAGKPVGNGTFAAYLTTVVLEHWPCSSAVMHVAADTKYWLYVNGEMVVFEGGLKRGPKPGAGYFDSLNVSSAPWRAGPNTVAVLALYLGRRTVPATQEWWNNEHADSGRHALLVASTICGGGGTGGGTAFVSDSETWRAIPHPGYSNDLHSDAAQNFRFSEPDVIYDAAAAAPLAGWTAPGFDSSAWPKAARLGGAGDAPWGALVPRPIPLWRRSSGLRRYVSLRAESDADDGDGFRAVGAADIPGQDLVGALPAGCCATAAACKAACLAAPSCRAAVWGSAKASCNLKTRTRVVASATSPYTVYLRAYKRLAAKLPYDAHVTPTLRPAAGETLPPGVRIDIRTDSYLTDASSKDKADGFGIPNTRAAYVADGSEWGPSEVYETPGWMVGHYVIYAVDKTAPLDLGTQLDVGYYETGYATSLTPPFQCDVPALNTLWRKAQRTLYVNMRDNYMDCPDRERSQWPFDVAMDVHQAFYALGPESSALSAKWIAEMVAWQKVDQSSPAYEPSYAPQSIYGPVPGHWVAELPNQSLQSIAYGFGVYFDHTGDAASMRGMLRPVVRYLLSWKTSAAPGGKGSLVEPRKCPGLPHGADVQCPGIWDWCDGESVNCDYQLIDNAWYWWALNTTARVSRAVNASRSGGEVVASDLAELERRASSLRTAFDAEFYDDSCQCYRSAAHRVRVGGTTNCSTKKDNCTLPDDRANALAIVTGLAPREKWAAVVRAVLDTSTSTSTASGHSPNATSASSPGHGVAFASTAMEKFVLEAMFLAGEHDAALARMQQRFAPMIEHNLTTLWEHWETDATTGDPIAGYNHGWSGGVLVLLSQYVAGLAPTSPGWATFEARPRLRNVSATVATARGDVRLAAELRASGDSGSRSAFHVTLVVPPQTRARLILPHSSACGQPSEVLLSAAQLPRHGTSSPTVADGRKPLELPPGTWAVEAQCEAALPRGGNEDQTSLGDAPTCHQCALQGQCTELQQYCQGCSYDPAKQAPCMGGGCCCNC